MDTRLINQVVVWERIAEMENEKHRNLHPNAQTYPLPASQPCNTEHKPTFDRIFKLGQNRNFSTRSSEPA